jgi:hypothetical protein
MDILSEFVTIFFIILFQSIGVYFQVWLKVNALDGLHPDKNYREIMRMFWKHDWDTIALSGGILVLHLSVHLVIDIYATGLKDIIPHYELWDFAVALVAGYGGQTWIYSKLGKLTDVLDKKI